MKIALGSDHGGITLKALIKDHLTGLGHEVTDFGTHTQQSCHYPEYAQKVAVSVASGENLMGILVCGTGIGMSMAANKVRGVRAAVAGDCFSARLTRLHNDANVLCIGERVTGPGLALMIVDEFLGAQFEGGRHETRVGMISAIEAEEGK